MSYGICHLSVVPVREVANDTAVMCDQLLFGEHFRILEARKLWSRVQRPGDKSEGWVFNEQFKSLEEDVFLKLEASRAEYCNELVAHTALGDTELVPVLLGSLVSGCAELGAKYEGESRHSAGGREALLNTSLLYLNAPYLQGGRSPFGIDAGGFTQMVYRISGYAINRTPSTQALQGEVLSFVEESEAGDLAFFDNEEGEIIHVGLLLGDNYIIHAHGKVRIDRIDHTGIFNREKGRYSHQLRMIKKIIP